MTDPRPTQRLDALPQDVPPPRDLWPAIAAQIQADAAPRAPRARRLVAPWLGWAVTAGLAAAVAGAWWLQRGTGLGGRLDPEVAALDAQDPALADERARLARELSAMLETLPLDARLGAQQSLRAVRSARSDIVAALRRDADDPALHEWLRDNREREVQVMQAIVDAGARTRAL